jgi:toxin ParE1/3/4
VPADFSLFHEDAAAEYDAAFDWYLERSPDAARRFDVEMGRALEQIVQAPRRWAIGIHSTRRFLLKQFPFIVIYREQPSGIQIVAVAHTSRKPGYWRTRL